MLLSLFFSDESGERRREARAADRVLRLRRSRSACTIVGLERSMRVSAMLVKLQDTTAEIRVRGAFLLLALFVVLASKFGLEAILGAFLAGATLKLVDRDEGMTHAFFHQKLAGGRLRRLRPVLLRLDRDQARRREPVPRAAPHSARVPIFLAAMLLVARGLPALLYRPLRRARSPARRGRSPPGDVAQHPRRRRPDRRRDGADPARRTTSPSSPPA